MGGAPPGPQGRAQQGPAEGPPGPREDPIRAQCPVRARSTRQTLVYIYIYIYIYICICIYMHIYSYIYIYIHIEIYIYIYSNLYVYGHIYVYIFTRLCLVARVLVFVRISQSFPMPPLAYCKLLARNMSCHGLDTRSHANKSENITTCTQNHPRNDLIQI